MTKFYLLYQTKIYLSIPKKSCPSWLVKILYCFPLWQLWRWRKEVFQVACPTCHRWIGLSRSCWQLLLNSPVFPEYLRLTSEGIKYLKARFFCYKKLLAFCGISLNLPSSGTDFTNIKALSLHPNVSKRKSILIMLITDCLDFIKHGKKTLEASLHICWRSTFMNKDIQRRDPHFWKIYFPPTSVCTHTIQPRSWKVYKLLDTMLNYICRRRSENNELTERF